jgi:cobalt-zinc-cadmium resistance protein CzcA
MVRKLIEWAVNSALVVLLLAGALACFGIYAYKNVNVEAYPDPAPAIIEVLAQYPGYSAEEVERLITVPLEIALAGMPGLQYTRSKSLAGLSHLRNQFEYGVDYYAARQEVLNRLNSMPPLPGNVSPQISPFTPTGELVRYTLVGPREALEPDNPDAPHSELFGRYTVSDRPGWSGRDVYSLLDLKALEDWTLEREFKRLPRIADVTSFGGMVKRYEVLPDPERLKRYGVTLTQFQNAVANANANIGAGFVVQGPVAQNVRGIGLFGLGRDPMLKAQAMRGKPYVAAQYLHEEGRRRVNEIREVVVVAVNNVAVRVKDLVSGGSPEAPSPEGVSVGYVPRLGKVSVCRPKRDDSGQEVRDEQGNLVWVDEQDVVQGIVLMRKNEATLPSLQKVHEKIKEMNETPGAMLPGTRIELHFDLTGLLHVTTETVQENLLLGMTLVTVILLMFISNVRCALIVAVNIPLALLFAFSVLFIRGKSANLLSIGAVDFGIIVDSSVIMVENIYRHLSSGEYAELSLKDRIIRACHEVEKPLFFSTAIMVCAFIPLFTMHGPEGQIFGPMADTYAFALGGALVLAVTVAPVLCLLLLKNLKPARDNFLVRYLKRSYLRQLDRCLRYRWLTLGLFVVLTLGTVALLPYLGNEFMPELEEGNFYLRATFPVNVSLEEAADKARRARAVMRQFPEVQLVASQVGRPDDGTDPTGFYNVEFHVPLLPEKEWPALVEQQGWRRLLFGSHRARTKPELKAAMNEALSLAIPGIDWNFSQYIRDNVMESLSGVKGDNSVKIIGPDLNELERLAVDFKAELDKVHGVENVGVFRILGQPNLEFTIDRKKCSFWSVSVQDVLNAIKIAVGGNAVSQMVEGEKTFDIALRWPERLRGNEQAILGIPVEVTNNTVTPGMQPSIPATPVTGPAVGVSTIGTVVPMPSLLGNVFNAAINNLSTVPRLRLRHLVTPVNADGQPDADGTYLRIGASTIYREQGKRLIAVKFSVNNAKRDLGGAVAEAQERTAALLPTGYKTEWSGEFQEMKEAQERLMVIIPVSLGLICILLYLAFHNLLDVLAILSNVLALCMGGVWALLLTGHNFSISAAVGFISIFGVAIMDGLLLISYFNHLRAEGLPLREAILQGAEKRVRPVMMTALTAIFGLLPAALSTRIGAQTQRPLAIVVVGGMISTLFLTRYLMPVLYSFYGHREPTQESGGLAH